MHLKDCNCSFYLIFSCFNWFRYCRGNCICAGQGNTIVSHFVVCWKFSAAEQIKPDCCHTPAVVSIFDRLRCLGHCPLTAAPHHYILTAKLCIKDTHTQQQTRLEQLRAYSGEKLETGYVNTWGMYETERQKQIERDIEREFSLKGNVQQKTRK